MELVHISKKFHSAPIFKVFLVNPIYDVYVAGEQEIIANVMQH
jgi:CRISPR-associated protein Cas5h